MRLQPIHIARWLVMPLAACSPSTSSSGCIEPTPHTVLHEAYCTDVPSKVCFQPGNSGF